MEVTSVLLSILTVLLSIVVYFVYYNLTYWKRRNISHSKPHLIYGNFKGVRSEYHEQDIYRSFYNKHKGNGPFAGFYFMIKPLVFVTDIKLARNILIKDFSSFTDRIAYYNEKDDPISAHLFSIDNPQWRELRTKLSPTFTSGKIKYMYPTVLRVCEQFVKIIGEKYSNNQSLDIKELYACFTTDVIGTCAFGIECNCLTNPEAEFRRVGRKFLDTLTVTNLKIGFATGFPKIARKLGITITPPDVSDFFLNTIRETVAYREEHNIKRNDFLDLLIEIKNNKEYGLTIEEIAAQAFIFFFGGFETSSSTSSFALYELARNQDIQNKLRNEINETLQRHNNQFSFECINDMIYLDQVINETLRMYSILPILIRRAVNDYIVNDDPKYKIDKGMPVIIPSCGFHMDPDYYPEPHIFNPDNFSPENIKLREHSAFLAFGDGPRNCIGMRFGRIQVRLGIAMLLQKYKFVIGPDTAIPVQIDKNSSFCTSRGIRLYIENV